MPPYDDRLFAPPAPVLNARLRNPQSGIIIPDVSLLIDTGADVTLLPLGAVSACLATLPGPVVLFYDQPRDLHQTGRFVDRARKAE